MLSVSRIRVFWRQGATRLEIFSSQTVSEPTARDAGRWVFCFWAIANGNRLKMSHITTAEVENRDGADAGLLASAVYAGRLSHLRKLEAESIYIVREAVAEFSHPVMMYSIGKDSSVMLRLAQKAFHPGKIPFPLLHIDTSYKFPEMISFRDAYTKEIGADLVVHRNEAAIADGASPWKLGTQNCCGALKTRSLLDALEEGGVDAAL